MSNNLNSEIIEDLEYIATDPTSARIMDISQVCRKAAEALREADLLVKYQDITVQQMIKETAIAEEMLDKENLIVEFYRRVVPLREKAEVEKSKIDPSREQK